MRHASCTSLGNSGVKSPPDRPRYSFCGLTQCRVVEMDVAIRRGRPPMPEQASCDMQALAVHDRVRGVRVSKVMEPGIRHEPGCVACRASSRPCTGAKARAPVSSSCSPYSDPSRSFRSRPARRKQGRQKGRFRWRCPTLNRTQKTLRSRPYGLFPKPHRDEIHPLYLFHATCRSVLSRPKRRSGEGIFCFQDPRT